MQVSTSMFCLSISKGCVWLRIPNNGKGIKALKTPTFSQRNGELKYKKIFGWYVSFIPKTDNYNPYDTINMVMNLAFVIIACFLCGAALWLFTKGVLPFGFCFAFGSLIIGVAISKIKLL